MPYICHVENPQRQILLIQKLEQMNKETILKGAILFGYAIFLGALLVLLLSLENFIYNF